MSVSRRQVVVDAIEFRPVDYVPWAWQPTSACRKRLCDHLGTDDLSSFLGSHFFDVGPTVPLYTQANESCVRDIYGTVWDRSVDKDIGSPIDWPIKSPSDLASYDWPDATDDSWYQGTAEAVADHPELLSRYKLGFSLYERAWSMRGMTELLMDMVERPSFVEDLLDAIVEHRLIQVRRALACGVDAVYFGDDYGMQTGLIMGLERWRHFIKPRLAKMFAPVREAGKFVTMHSCGAVAELFDDLVEIGLDLFNPFQPEVMDIEKIKRDYHGRLAFHGGMSIQNILPFGSVEDVRAETARLIEMGQDGGYIFSPSHSVPPDVPPENLVAMMEVLRAQPGAPQI